MKPWQQTLMNFAAVASETKRTPVASQKATSFFVKAFYYWAQDNAIYHALLGKAVVEAGRTQASAPLFILEDLSGSISPEELQEGMAQLSALSVEEIN